MAKITTIDNADAPVKPYKPQGKMAKQSIAVLDGLKPGKTTTLEPEEGETTRGLKVSLSRIAGKRKLPVDVWSDESKVYVQLKE